jgi:DNA polymerase I
MNLIIDGMNIAFRSHHVYDVQQGLKTASGIPTGIIYGFLKTLVGWRRDYPKHQILVAWDSPGAHAYRRALYSGYKANRDRNFETISDPTQEDRIVDIFGFQVEILQAALEGLGIRQVKKEGYEADDLIAHLVRNPFKDSVNMTLSSDRDLLKLVGRKTVLMTPDRKAYDRDTVLGEYGVPPEYLLCYKALDGDKSDNLPGVPRVRRKLLASLVTKGEGTLDGVYDSSLQDGLSVNEKQKLRDFQTQAFINQSVMDFREVDHLQVTTPEVDFDKVSHICDMFDLKSLKGDLLSYDRPASGFLRFGE